MRTKPVFPYLRPGPDSIEYEGWTINGSEPLPERLEHWDQFSDINLELAMEVDPQKIATETGLGPDARFTAVATWYSTRTRIGGCSESLDFEASEEPFRLEMEVHVPGSDAGGRLRLSGAIALRWAGTASSAISPLREGAALWSRSEDVFLEGTASRFPISVLAFSKSGRFPDSAGWALDWDPDDLEVPVLGGLRLLLNSEDDVLVASLRTGASDAMSKAVRKFVFMDVVRTLVHGALRNEQFVRSPDAYPEASVGRMLRHIVTEIWPSTTVAGVRARLLTDQTALDTEIQAYAGGLI